MSKMTTTHRLWDLQCNERIRGKFVKCQLKEMSLLKNLVTSADLQYVFQLAFHHYYNSFAPDIEL